MRNGWMNKDFIRAIQSAIDNIDEAYSFIDDAIWEADNVQDNDDASECSDELRWDCQDAIEGVRNILEEMISDEE